MPLTWDLACLTKMINEYLTGMEETSVEKTSTTRITNFKKKSRLAKRTFECNNISFVFFVFADTKIEREGESFLFNQATYTSRLQPLS